MVTDRWCHPTMPLVPWPFAQADHFNLQMNWRTTGYWHSTRHFWKQSKFYPNFSDITNNDNAQGIQFSFLSRLLWWRSQADTLWSLPSPPYAPHSCNAAAPTSVWRNIDPSIAGLDWLVLSTGEYSFLCMDGFLCS
jgi:hypothetical protein